MRYNPGDVVLVHFPWDEADGTINWKLRPAVVLEINSPEERLLIQITSKNRSKTSPGVWITKESDEGHRMGLLTDSFINLAVKKELHVRDIVRVIGYCSETLMEKIRKKINPED
jgi:hypothetical protein